VALSTDRLASALVTESLAVAIHCLVAAVLIGAQSGWRGRSGYLRRSAVTAAGCAGMVAESIWLRLGDVLIAEEGGRERSRRRELRGVALREMATPTGLCLHARVLTRSSLGLGRNKLGLMGFL
jgi:hypothetical protein